MKTKQEAEREEQQRIKNLVLNYDLRDDNDSHDGINISGPIQQHPLKRSSYAKGYQIRTRPPKRIS